MVQLFGEKKHNRRRSSLSLNKFTTISVIGQGSYARVFLVRNMEDGELYALKTLNKERVDSEKQRKHVRTERDVLVEASRSPFLIGFIGSFQTANKLCFVLEYCAGGELFNYLQRCRKFDEATTRFYAAQILLALEYLHQKNIIYRDLKPENVLIGADGYVRIADFGLSRTNVVTDEARSILGTPEYLAPEVLLKLGYGKAVDWWAFGSLIFEMLTGFPPFYSNSRNRAELFERIKFLPPTYPSYLSAETKCFLQELMRKDPGQRLGANGAGDIKRHQWFESINFDAVVQKLLPPPFVPCIGQTFGLQNFDKAFTDVSVASTEAEERQFQNFEGFTWEERTGSESATPVAIETASTRRPTLASLSVEEIDESRLQGYNY